MPSGAPGARRIAAAAAIALNLVFAAAAGAQPTSGAATMQFDKGRALMKEKKYAEACAAFEHSQKLDPQLGTLYNLALCYAQLGKIASAWNAYREVGQRDTNANRKQEATRRAKELEKRIPKLLLTIPAAPPGLVVTMDGVDVTALVGTDNPVDPSRYELKATAPGHAAWETTAMITEEGKTIRIELELERLSSGAGAPDPDARTADPSARGAGAAPARSGRGGRAAGRRNGPPERPDPASRHRRAFAVGITGAAALATGLMFTGLAYAKWDAAMQVCPDTACRSSDDYYRAADFYYPAKKHAHLATGFVSGGAVLLGAGVVLWLTAPSQKASPGAAARIAPRVGPGHVAVTLEGRLP